MEPIVDFLSADLENEFPPEKIRMLTLAEIDSKNIFLEESWKTFCQKYLTDVARMDVENKIKFILDILSDTYNTIRYLLCGLYCVTDEKDCKKRKKIRNIEKIILEFEYAVKHHKKNHFRLLTEEYNHHKICHSIVEFLHNKLNDDEKNEILKYYNSISHESQNFLSYLNDLNTSTAYHVNLLAPKSSEKGFYFFNRLQDTIKIEQKVESVCKKIRLLNDKTTKFKNEKLLILENGEKMINDMTIKLHEDELNLQTNFENQLKELKDNFEITKSVCKQRLIEIKQKYEEEIKHNRQDHKKLSEHKYRKEVNLLKWIEKYDADCLLRYHELEILKKEHQELTDILTDIKSKTLIQDTEWKIYLEEKREDTRIKLYLTVINRAAKTIQVWWKKTIRRIKKKRKKLLKKMQKAAKKRR